ncbi:hypothetical protein MIB92_01735 [Aestuariirhabdus sp. Z084]|uniref:hypothetical protein n=1 Tax=Aestuariirhabdus haliotis TaxID=2918751 RepID=UPI00201B3D4C|nr:hypothetical protein [Aestuariirhabdus haliotis]MCL6414360.1 hypothetical protein [Aestuariirhabdus haliotis]MCL6418292.1 hypothetical protein [Aestuariirhabdus haliotis]
MTLAYSLGVILLLWVTYDLFSGSAWLHRKFYRAQEPLAYWSTMLLWLLVAASCFFWEF